MILTLMLNFALAWTFDPVTYRLHLARARVDKLDSSGAAWSA